MLVERIVEVVMELGEGFLGSVAVEHTGCNDEGLRYLH